MSVVGGFPTAGNRESWMALGWGRVGIGAPRLSVAGVNRGVCFIRELEGCYAQRQLLLGRIEE